MTSDTPTPAAFPAQMDLSEGERLHREKCSALKAWKANASHDTFHASSVTFGAWDDWCEANLPSLIAAARERDALRAQNDRLARAWEAKHASMVQERERNAADEEKMRQRIAELIAERDVLREALEPFIRAADAAEKSGLPATASVFRAALDYEMRSLGRDNSEDIYRDSVRASDLYRLRDLTLAMNREQSEGAVG